MGPNPRDQLAPGQPVPLDRVRDVIANALRPVLANPAHRFDAAGYIVERLGYFRLLAADVQPAPIVTPHTMLATYVPAGASMQTPTPPTAAKPPTSLASIMKAEIDGDPIPPGRYCRCLDCCCSEGEGHRSPEYRAWEARRRG
jgi:hypothetical protein